MKTEQGRLAASVILLVATVVAKAAAESPPVPNLRLGKEVHPTAYSAELVVVPERSNFTGQITIELVLAQRSSFFWLHGHGLTVTNAFLEQYGRKIPAQPVMGSEDFADMLRAIPGAYCWIGHSGDKPVHNPEYTFDDAMIPLGASVMARIIEKRLRAERV